MRAVKDMNEYQLRDLRKYEESRTRLAEIVKELNYEGFNELGNFEINAEDPNNTCDHVPNRLFISAEIFGEQGEDETHRLEIMCERNGYSCRDKWEFTATGWPSYINELGQRKQESPYTNFRINEERPQSKAGMDRPAKAIAKQIQNRILGDYLRLYGICLEAANKSAAYGRKVADARIRLADACQDAREFRGQPQRTFYVKNISGDPIHVEFRSEGDVKVNLTTDEAIAVIELLRERRA